MTELIPTAEQLLNARQVLAMAGISTTEALAGLDAFRQADIRNALPDRRDVQPPGHRCHRCQAPATAQWTRYASAQEAEDWHTAREQHIRTHNDGRAAAEYVSDRTDTVALAVHGCDDHDLSPGPADDTNAAEYEARQLGADRRALLHDADCGGHGACECGGNDAQAV